MSILSIEPAAPKAFPTRIRLLSEKNAASEQTSSSSPRLAIALFNDTGKSNHVGCRAVSSGHDRMLRRLGLEVRHRAFLNDWSALWKGDVHASLAAFHKSDIPRLLAEVDALVVNGEGTIHHRNGLHLLILLAGAQQLGVRSFLVNAVFQECDQFCDTLRNLEDFSVRDGRSSAYLERLRVPHRLVFDSILEADFDPRPVHDFSGKIVVTDWHAARRQDVGRLLQGLLTELGAEAVHYALECPARATDWRHAVADLRNARLVVTGRHHGVCLAGLAGVPFVALGSNTWKIEGLLEGLPGRLHVCENARDLRVQCQLAVANPSLFGEIQQHLVEQRPLPTFDPLVKESGMRTHNSSPALELSAQSGAEAAFAVQLAELFGSTFVVQLDWLGDADVCVLTHQPDRGELSSRIIHTASTCPQLPFGDGSCETVVNVASLGSLSDSSLPGWLKELSRVTGRNLWVALPSTPSRNRAWWETKFFAAGFRKHPLAQQLQPHAALRPEGEDLILVLEKMPADSCCRQAPLPAQTDADRHHAEWWVVAAQGVVAQPAVHLAGTSFRQTLPDDDQLDLWLDEALTVCGEGRALVAGPGATRVVGRLLHRGIDAWGVDTATRASAATHGGRCVGGSVTTLPLERGPFRSVLFLGALDELDEAVLGQVLGQVRRAVEGSLHLRVFTRVAGRDRRWWEATILQAGFRKHPIRPPLRPGEGPNPGDPLVFYFERLTEAGGALDGSPASVTTLDPSRNAGREGDLILARYQWAAALVRPWDTVLDLGCGCGCGTHILRRSSRGARFIGVDAAANAIDYAQAHFTAPIVEFRCCPDPADILMELPEASVDFAVCALPLDDLESVDGLLSGTQRILAPGGRLVFTVAGHSTAFGAGGLRSQLAGRYLMESAHRQAGDEHRPESADLREITLAEVGLEEAEAWLLVVMKDPLMSPLPAYRETAFRHVAAGEHAAVLRYPEFYANPWILHALVHGGWRMSSQRVLAETLQRLLQGSPEDSADAGAALCILLYRVIAGVVPAGPETDLLVRQAERFRNLPAPNAHQFRWQLSITFALAQLALHQGALDRARELFGAVGAMDVFKWGPSLATKASEALFNAGWIAWCAEDLDTCRQFWTQGLELGRKLLARPLDETLINPECPNLFCAGDGMRELVYALENVGRCGHGLHALHLREQGISCSWEPIFNSFRWQLERNDTSLRLAQRKLRRAGEAHSSAAPYS